MLAFSNNTCGEIFYGHCGNVMIGLLVQTTLEGEIDDDLKLKIFFNHMLPLCIYVSWKEAQTMVEKMLGN